MRVSIIGTGAIGGFYGIMLANVGYHVDFLLRNDYDFVKTNGLKLHSAVYGEIVLPHVNAYSDISEMPANDILLISLKTTENRLSLAAMLSEVRYDSQLVVLVQNGLEMEKDLSDLFPTMQIAGGVALITSFRSGRGEIVHQDHGNLDMGGFSLRQPEKLEEFSTMLKIAGVDSSCENLDYLRWKKLVWNMCFNGLCVKYNCNTHELIADSILRDEAKRIMDEVVAAARVCGVNLPDRFADTMLAFTESMRPYHPSMKLDYDNFRPMELEYLYRRPIAAARREGFEMKQAEELYRYLLAVGSAV